MPKNFRAYARITLEPPLLKLWLRACTEYRTRALLGVCAYISTGSKPPLNSEYAPNSEMDNLIWMGIN